MLDSNLPRNTIQPMLLIHWLHTCSSILLWNGETIGSGRTKYGLQISNVLKHRAHCQHVRAG